MKSLIGVAAEIQEFFTRRSWKFCFIGGLALQRWGAPRLTVDVDISLLTGFGQEDRYVTALLERFSPRIPDAADFALKHRVLLLKSKDGVGIDIALAALPFEKETIDRATDFEYLPGIKLHTCSAEDLIVLKAFADRLQDWVDIDNIAERQAGRLDQSYILTRLQPLCEIKGQPDIIERLKRLLKSPRT